MSRHLFSRVDRQVALLLGVMLFLSSFAIYVVSTEIFRDSTLKTVAARAEKIHHYIEFHVKSENFLALTGWDQVRNQNVKGIENQLDAMRSLARLNYLYSARRDDDGTIDYAVDFQQEGARSFFYPSASIGKDVRNGLDRALNGQVVLPARILDTDRGHVFLAFFPLRDHSSGMVIGSVGLEFPAENEYETFGNLKVGMFLTCSGFFLLALLLSFLAFRRIWNPIRILSTTDALTGLRNRSALEFDRHNLNMNANGCAADCTVLVVDINNLKLVNDSLGHDMGDRCIRAAGKAILSVVNENVTGYRIGGDEFVIFHLGEGNPEDLVRRIKEKFEPFRKSIKVPVALAVGMAAFDAAQDRELYDTQKRADFAMYKDKVELKVHDRESGSELDR